MDAARKLIQNTALFAAALLLAVAPGHAQSPFTASPNPVALSAGSQFVQVTIAGTGAFTIATNGTFFNIQGGVTTGTAPTQFTVGIANTSCANGGTTCSGSITLHPTSVSGTAQDLTIPVTFSSGGGGGGGTSGAIVANPTSVTITPANGQVASATVALTTSSSTPITFSTSTNPQSSWLSVGVSTSQISSTSGAFLSVFANPTGFNTSQTGSITITPSNGGAQTTISVTMTINGGGTGTSTYTLSPNNVSFAYPTGTQQQTIVIFNSVSLTTFNVMVANCNSSNFLLANGGTLLSSQFVSGGLNLTLNTSVAAGLQTGSYTCQAIVSNPSNSSDQAAVTVTLSVNGGTGGNTNYALNPSSVTFTSAVGSTNTQPTSVNVVSSVATTYNATFTSFSGGNWLILNGIGQSVTNQAVPGLTLSLNNPQSFTAGQYSGQVTITNPTGSGSATLPVTLNVGNAGGSGSYTLSANTETFQYPFGTQSASITISSSTQSSFVASASTQSGGSWLGVAQGASSGTSITGQVSQGLTVYLNLSAVPSTSGTYSGQVTVSNPSNANDNAVIFVTLQQNLGGGGGNGSSVSPTSLSFSTSPGVAPANQNLTVTVPAGTSTFTTTISGSPIFINTPCNSCSYVGSQNISVSVNPSLSAGTYTNTISFTSGGTNFANVTVTLSIGNNGTGGGTSSIVAPTSLSFYYQAGKSTVPPQQTITINSTGTFSASSTQNWLIVSPTTGTAPGGVVVSVIPNSFAAGSVQQGTVNISTNSGSTSVNVTLTVSSGAVLYSSPATLNFSYVSGSSSTLQNVAQIFASDNSSQTVTATTPTSWISLSSPTNGGATPTSYLITITPTGLCNGLNTGSVSVTGSNVANSPLTIPVAVLVSGSSNTNCGSSSGSLTLSATSLTFAAGLNGSAPSTQNLTVTPPSGSTQFTVSTNITSGSTNWLNVISPCNNCALTGSQTLTISVNQSGLGSGTYQGNILLTSNGSTQQVPVTLTVGASGGSGNISASSTNLNFSAALNGSTQTQSLNISSASGAAGVGFTFGATTTSGGNWLSVSTSGGGQSAQTPVTLTVSANPSGLAAGSYAGSITLSPNGGTQITIPVNFAVQANVISATPTSLTFNYQAGSAAPSSQTIAVSGGGASLNFTASATTSTGSGWLSVTPTSGSTGTGSANVTVSVSPSGLNPGTYSGTVTVSGANGATGTSTTSVSLTVSAPLPTITQVTSAASYIGQTISPGEIIVIFGTGLGPTPLVSLTLDSTGKVSTSLGGVQVLVGGVAAPMIYASNTQVAAVVPYDVAQLRSTTVIVKFLNQTSNGISLGVSSTQPGIFTANASGTGPGAILNSNFSPNSPTNPAAKGSTVAIYMTGEGLTSPASVNGGVTVANLPAPQVTPAALLPVAATIDGQPVTVQYAGEAPGLVAGVLQVNVLVPATARTGDLPLIVSVGGVTSQTGVTVSVK